MRLIRLAYLLLLAIFILLVEYFEVPGDKSLTTLLEIELAVFYFVSLVVVVKKYGIFHIGSLYCFTFGLFNFGNFFFELFLGTDFRNVFSTVEINLREETVQKMLVVYLFYYVVFFFSFLILMEYRVHKRRGGKVEPEIGENYKLEKIGTTVMRVFFLFALARVLMEIRGVMSSGELIYVSGASSSVPFPIKIGELLYRCGYMILLMSRPPQKTYIKYSILYFIVDAPNVAIGLRATIVEDILFMVYYYSKVYNVRIKAYKVIVPGVLAIFALQTMALMRWGGEMNATVKELLPMFLASQSTSVYVLGLYIQNFNLPHNYPFILDPIMIFFLPQYTGQSLETLQHRSNLGHQLIYHMDSSAYLAGHSLGTTQVAELYEFGIIGIIIGAFIYAAFLCLLDKKLLSSRKWLFASLVLVTSVMMAPRSYYLPGLYSLVKLVIVYIFIMTVANKISKKKGGAIKQIHSQ